MGWFDNLFRRQSNEVPPPPPPPDPRVERERKRVELTMAKNDLQQKQADYNKLVPDEAQKAIIKKANNDMDAYTGPKQTQFEYELRLFNTALNQVDALSNSGSIMLAQKYRKELNSKHQKVASEYQKNKEKAFTNRRRFLDASPQEGVPGLSWFQSIDDQVMLIFWICYTLFFGTLLTYVVSYFGAKIGSQRNVMIVWSVLLVLCVVIAHSAIRVYG
jgi:hypothetical protein